MAHGETREGKWRGNWRMEWVASERVSISWVQDLMAPKHLGLKAGPLWVASTLHTTSEYGVSSITTTDAHTSAASSRLNWGPHWFKWTRLFRWKTKSGFCACAITFQMQFTDVLDKPDAFIFRVDYKAMQKNVVCYLNYFLLFCVSRAVFCCMV
jgi:hypothetical protein